MIRARERLAAFWRVVDERLGLGALRYEVPEYGNVLAYTLGGITLFSFVVVGFTGIYLAQFYNPNPDQANASVRIIVSSVFLGSFMRNLHYWAAQAAMVSIILHITRVYITGAYRRPREFNWIVGVGLLSTSIGLFFTGTVLKWDQEAFEAVQHNIEMSELLGSFGAFFSPEFAEGVPLLTRLYTAHVSLLPIIFLVLLILHVFYVRHFGIAPIPQSMRRRLATDPDRAISFFEHLKKIVLWGMFVLLLTAVLAAVLPAPLGPEPIEGIEVTKPPWPFLWMFPIESMLGIGWLLPVSVTPIILLLIVPFLDRGKDRDPRSRLLFIIAFLVGLAILFALTILAALTGPAEHIGG